MAVPMLDLRAQYERIKPEIQAAVTEVFETQGFVGGPNVVGLEEEIAAYVGTRHAVGVASGTDALLLLLKAMDLQPGDEVITTAFSFFATAGAVANAGGTPVFVDIDPETFNIDMNQIESKITPRTKAIIPVHLYGQCADMDPILAMADKYGLRVFEDSAQSLGAAYKNRKACALGHGAAISFYPTKNLGGAGDAGMVVTDDDALARRVRLLRTHGADATYYHEIVGTNSRLDALQAAVLRVKLRYLDTWNEERRARAVYYDEALAGLPGIVRPCAAEHNRHVYHQYVIRVPQRDDARAALMQRKIGCAVFYPVPLPQLQCFQYLGISESACPEAARASREVLALPMFPELTREQQDEVVAALGEHLESAQ